MTLNLHLFILADVFVSNPLSRTTVLQCPRSIQEALSRILVAVPPLDEHQRIVAKAREMVALCDQLEAAITIREDVRVRSLRVVWLTCSKMCLLTPQSGVSRFR